VDRVGAREAASWSRSRGPRGASGAVPPHGCPQL
jgi:hypothetical protein